MEIVLLIFLVVLAVCCLWGFTELGKKIRKLSSRPAASKADIDAVAHESHLVDLRCSSIGKRCEELKVKMDDREAMHRRQVLELHEQISAISSTTGALSIGSNDLNDRIEKLEHSSLRDDVLDAHQKIYDLTEELGELIVRVGKLESQPEPPQPGNGLNSVIDAAIGLGSDFSVVIYRGDREVCSIRDGQAVRFEEC